jgi:hypothetical protein
LLELLSDFQVSIPERTIKAVTIPHVVLTSNGTRALSDARAAAASITMSIIPMSTARRASSWRIAGAGTSLSLQSRGGRGIGRRSCARCRAWRDAGWAAALVGLGVRISTRPGVVHETLMCLLKTHEDKSRVSRGSPNACWGRSHELLRRSPAMTARQVSRLVSVKLAAFLGPCVTMAAVGLHEAATPRR